MKMRTILFVLTIVVISACTFNTNEQGKSDSDNNRIVFEDRPSVPKHKRLISFKSTLVMKMDELMLKPQKEINRLHDNNSFHKEPDTISYLKDTLYISYLDCVNENGRYDNNIDFKNDSLILRTINLSRLACMCERIDEFTYVIYNPRNERYKIIRE